MAEIIRYVTVRDESGERRRYPVVSAEEEEYWSAPRMWDDCTAFILGGGPSLKDMDLSLIEGEKVIGVNDAYIYSELVNVCAFGDRDWFDLHDRDYLQRTDGSSHPALRKFGGVIVSYCREILTRDRTDVRVMKPEPRGFRRKPYEIGWNGNTGIATINLALHFGVSRVVLLGFDMKNRDGNTNWHDNLRHAHEENFNPNYDKWLSNIRYCERDRKRYWRHVEILNATPDSAIPDTVWPHVDLEKVV